MSEPPPRADVPRAHRCSAPAPYTPRQPEATLLRQVIRGHLETLLARGRVRDRPVRRFVERELRAYLGCGVLAWGILRLHCDACGCDRFVSFSCKGRICPSYGGRRMADTAAHLVDRVLPELPVRQWVLSLPFALRYRLAYDARLTSEVQNLFLRTLFASLRRRARRPGVALRGVPRVRGSDRVEGLLHHAQRLQHDPRFRGARGGGRDDRPRSDRRSVRGSAAVRPGSDLRPVLRPL